MIYTVTFNPAIDYVVRLNAPLEVGEVNRAKGEDCVLGGKGINVSGVLAQLGCESVALGFVAGETGAWLERGLAAQGLKTDFVHLEQGMTRINVKIKAGQETELNGAGPDIPESAMQELEKKLDSLNEDDILILAGSIPASLSQDTYERLLARLQGRGVRAVVDATRDLLVNVLQYHPFLIKPNNHELGEIVGRVLTMDEEIIAAARTLQQKGARNVLVSMAGDGALLVDENGEVHRIGCPKGKVVNSVGAGDYLAHTFQKEYGISPITYLNCRRIEESKYMLGNTGYSLAQISELMGFSSPSYFSQCFRKAEGLTPNEYRRQVRQGQRPAPAKRHER